MAIALGNGSPVEKATELFEYFDKKCRQTLSREKLAYLFTEYSTIVAIVIPLLGSGHENEDLLPIEAIKKYQRKMFRNMVDAHKNFMKMMLESASNTEISLDEFVNKMASKDNAQLLTSIGLRRYVLQHGGFARRPKSNYYKEYNHRMDRIINLQPKGTASSSKPINLDRRKSAETSASSTGIP